MEKNKSSKGLFNAVGKRVVFPNWIWAYIELKASFYHMPIHAFLLTLVQREMEKTSVGIQRYMETKFFNEVNGIQENIDPFDSDVADILKTSYQYAKNLESELLDNSESFYIHNTATGTLEIKFADRHFKRSENLGFNTKLAKEGWIYDARFKVWRTKKRKQIKSADIGLAEKMINMINENILEKH